MDDVQIIMHVGSHHFEGEHEGFNPGIGIRVPNKRAFLTAGAYRNSLGRGTVYGGVGYTVAQANRVSFNVLAGLATGYEVPVAPMLLPEVAVSFGRWQGMLTWIPPVHAGEVNVDSAVAVSVGVRW